jgi:hypothetical protein
MGRRTRNSPSLDVIPEADLKTPLPRKFTFADPEKIRELARRGEAWGDSESRKCWRTLSSGGEVGST